MDFGDVAQCFIAHGFIAHGYIAHGYIAHGYAAHGFTLCSSDPTYGVANASIALGEIGRRSEEDVARSIRRELRPFAIGRIQQSADARYEFG